MPDKVESLARYRAEVRREVADAINPFAARAHIGEQRAVLVVGIREDGSADFQAAYEPRDLIALLGLIERAKADLLED